MSEQTERIGIAVEMCDVCPLLWGELILVLDTLVFQEIGSNGTFARVSERRVAEIVGQTGSRYDGTNFENVSVGKFWLLFYQGMRHIITQTSSHTCHFERMGQSVVHKYTAWQRKHLRLVL